MSEENKIAIIGGGLTGLTTAFFLKQQIEKKKLHNITIQIFEANHFGGNIQSQEFEGVNLEKGHDYFESQNGLPLRMLKDLGFSNEEILQKKAKDLTRFLIKDSNPVKIPGRKKSFMTNSILFLGDKMKAKAGYKKPLSAWAGMSIFEVFVNLMGPSFAEYFSSVMAKYLFMSEAEDIEFSSAFPLVFKQMSQGVTFKQALLNVTTTNKEYWQKELGEVYFAGELASFDTGLLITPLSGMSSIIEKLKEKLKEKSEFVKVELHSQKVTRILKIKNQYQINSKNTKFANIDYVVSTVNSTDMAPLFKELDKNISHQLKEEKPQASTAIIYSSWNVKEMKMPGFALYSPRKEKQMFTGSLNLSLAFPQKYPNQVLTRTIISGDSSVFSEEETANLFHENINRLFRSEVKPKWYKTYHLQNSIPDYSKGHFERWQMLDKKIAQYENIYINSQSRTGFLLDERLEQSYKLAQTITNKI